MLQSYPRAADAVDVWAVVPLLVVVLGFALPRWWIAAAALPFGSDSP